MVSSRARLRRGRRSPGEPPGLPRVGRSLRDLYRTAEDYHRYLVENAARRHELSRVYATYRSYFGHRVLDLACGGGVLGWVLAPTGRDYLGIDLNPDMVAAAHRSLGDRPGTPRVVRGNICTLRVAGRFDTLAMFDNALGHISPLEMVALLRTRRTNVHPGSTFLIDYRDVVGMFWTRTWSHRPYVQTHKRGRVVSLTRAVDVQGGTILIRSRPSSGQWVTDQTHAIWSPFVLESLMRSFGWRLVRRDSLPGRSRGGTPEHYLDVYRLEPEL